MSSDSIDKNDILATFLPYLFELRIQIKNLTKKKIPVLKDLLKGILGFGEGSTPFSDDILLGFLATYYYIEPKIEKNFKILALFPYERYTTKGVEKLG